MVNYERQQLDRTFAALGDPTRRAIVTRLAEGTASVGDLAEPFDMTLAAVLKHVRILEQAGLLTHHKTGRVRQCQLKTVALKQASAWLDHYSTFWEHQLTALAKFVDQSEALSTTQRETNGD